MARRHLFRWFRTHAHVLDVLGHSAPCLDQPAHDATAYDHAKPIPKRRDAGGVAVVANGGDHATRVARIGGALAARHASRLALAQQLAGRIEPPPRVVMLTCGALAFGGAPSDAAHGGAWGFARVLRLEHAALRTQSADVGRGCWSEVSACRMLLAPTSEAEAAWPSGSHAVVARLRACTTASNAHASLAVGAYAITGGLGRPRAARGHGARRRWCVYVSFLRRAAAAWCGMGRASRRSCIRWAGSLRCWRAIARALVM